MCLTINSFSQISLGRFQKLPIVLKLLIWISLRAVVTQQAEQIAEIGCHYGRAQNFWVPLSLAKECLRSEKFQKFVRNSRRQRVRRKRRYNP